MSRAALAALLFLSACSRPDAELERLLNAARDELRHGDLMQAHALAEQGLRLAHSQPASRLTWEVRLLHAEILLTQRNPADVISLLRERPHGMDAALRTRHTMLQGQWQILEGDLETAVETLGRAEDAARAGGDTDVLFTSMALRGQAQMRLRHWPAAQATLDTLIRQAGTAGDDYHLALGLINLGMGYLVRERFDQALPYFERAAALERVTLRIRGAALTNAGLCYTRLGDFDRAVLMQRRAVDAHAGSAPVFLEQALGELGSTYFLKGDVPAAIAHLERALAVARDAGAHQDAELWAGNLASVHISVKSWDRADELNRQARTLNEAAGHAGAERLVYVVLNDADIAAGRGQRNVAANRYRDALKRTAANPFITAAAHAGLARLDLAAGRLENASTHFEAAFAVMQAAHAGLLKTEYRLTYQSRMADLYDEYVEALMAQRRVGRALEVADSTRARVLAERRSPNGVRLASVAAFKRAARQAHSTLLAYRLGRQRSYAWAITADDVHVAELPGAAAIDSLVRQHQNEILNPLSRPLESTSTAGDALYAMLVKPFARLWRPGAAIIIVPDGALSRINFETLPVDGERRHYWIEDVLVTVAPSLHTLVTPPARTRAEPDAVLLIGDPASSDPQFPRLQFAGAEIDAVANTLPRAQKAVYRRERASPRAFHDSQPERFALIHFAAHAATNAESPLDSAVILSPDSSGSKLYARDIAEERLNADLVTISACRSAGDRTYSGEGLVGFAWAFLRAGARRVLAGLWDVDDRSTAELMAKVYDGLARGEPPAAAVRNAKLAHLARGGLFAKPYYWGPFQLVVSTP